MKFTANYVEPYTNSTTAMVMFANTLEDPDAPTYLTFQRPIEFDLNRRFAVEFVEDGPQIVFGDARSRGNRTGVGASRRQRGEYQRLALVGRCRRAWVVVEGRAKPIAGITGERFGLGRVGGPGWLPAGWWIEVHVGAASRPL